MRFAPRMRPALAAVSAVVAIGVLGGCTGDDPEVRPTGSDRGTSVDAPASATLGGIADEVLAYAPTEPVASGQGSLTTTSGTVPATADVAALRSTAGSTVLTFRLSTAQEATPDRGSLSHDGYGGAIDGVTLTVGDEKLYPGNFRYGVEVLAKNCTCTELIRSLGPDGVWLSAEFGALPEGTRTVDLTIPGFEAFAVPVST